MVVNSINFWLFFSVVFIAYYLFFRKSARWQNITLLIASYVFYGLVDWKMCFLLLVSTCIFYFLGIKISEYNEKDEVKASHLTTFAVALGIGLLVYFKYLGFFVEEFSQLLVSMGLQTNPTSFNIIMPLGISFFTFKLMGYAIEVHREEMEPSRDPIAFGTFIAFFPTIMSGPIDNPTKFMPQLDTVRTATYDNLSEGSKRILWGMFLKMCIADQLFGYTSAVLGNYEHHNATSIILASILYAFQLYTDFAGYSEMAIGVSQILGLRISENFNRPFLAQNIAEFWRRWHISLTTWITDYVFMPLNMTFRNLGKNGILLATFLNLVIIGAWHGANWTYILFGIYHAILFTFVLLLDPKRKKLETTHQLKNKWWYKYSRIFLTFVLVDIGMVMFQAKSVGDFFGTIGAMGNGFGMPYIMGLKTIAVCVLLIVVMLFKEYKDENKININMLHSNTRLIYLLTYILIIFIIILTGNFGSNQFIYFQF